MGSLMAGWDSPVLMDPDTAKLERGRSTTKEEIDDFWKGQGKLQIKCAEPHGEEAVKSPISTLSPSFKESPRKIRKWNGEEKESRDSSGYSTPVDSPVSSQKDKKNGDWWTRSTWAFLNEPPIDDTIKSTHKYAAQFDVAKMASSTSI